MPRHEADHPVAGIDELESSIRRLASAHSRERERAAAERARAEQCDELLRSFSDGQEDPAALARRVAALESENQELRRRLKEGRARLDHLLASIRFLEDRQ